MKVYLFRHGETDWNKDGRLQGQSDIPLNAFGRELAVKTAEALEGTLFDRAFSSPLKRAEETARIILGNRDIPLATDDRLKEISFGIYEGEKSIIARKDPAHPLHDLFCRPECYVPPEGAESFQTVRERAWEFLQEKIMPLEGTCGNVLVVAHGAFSRCLLSIIGDVPLEKFWEIELPNCAASILSVENGKVSIEEKSVVYYGEPVNGTL